jgi:type IV pilus assembly protein PilV
MNSDKGFTLLEVVISLLILAIGLLGMAALTTASIKVNSNANYLTMAYQIAQADLEELRRRPWTAITDGGKDHDSVNHPTFTSTWTVAITGKIKNVSLSVAWNDSRNHRIDLTTIIAR